MTTIKVYCDGSGHQRWWLETFTKYTPSSRPEDREWQHGIYGHQLLTQHASSEPGWRRLDDPGTRVKRRAVAARDRAMPSVDAATGHWLRLIEGYGAYRRVIGKPQASSPRIDTDGGMTTWQERGAGRVRRGPDGTVSVIMECTRCKARLTVTGDRLVIALDALADAGVTEISIQNLRRGMSN